ncbi:MAG: glycoside hydrolase family 27 protein [Bacteroidetes bacterium]|nr:glycoside hydrolase family 27 protein [Bacteroidota bacterium]
MQAQTGIRRRRVSSDRVIGLLVVVALAAVPRPGIAQKTNGLALTPPMGWNSWNTFGCNINEKVIREAADYMVSSGMKDAGYRYVNIDDCWHGERDARGFIRPDPDRFPSGMKAVADYVHSKGLKLGIYSDAGAKTCAGRPGSRGHEYQDALTYADWGVDYLKYDWCSTGELKAAEAYTTMRDALAASGRDIVLSICEWGTDKPWEWGPAIGHLWRTTGDITNCWDCVVDHGTWKSSGILAILDKQDGLRVHAGPDHWNDPDMMEVGNGMGEEADKAHFSMWAMLAAPLIAGNDLGKMDADTRTILTNREVIAVDQDSLGIQGYPFEKRGDIEIWFKPLAGGEWAMAVLNRGTGTRRVEFDWAREWVSDDHSHRAADFGNKKYRMRDLWRHEDAGTTAEPLSVDVPGPGVVMYRLTPQQR